MTRLAAYSNALGVLNYFCTLCNTDTVTFSDYGIAINVTAAFDPADGRAYSVRDYIKESLIDGAIWVIRYNENTNKDYFDIEWRF